MIKSRISIRVQFDIHGAQSQMIAPKKMKNCFPTQQCWRCRLHSKIQVQKNWLKHFVTTQRNQLLILVHLGSSLQLPLFPYFCILFHWFPSPAPGPWTPDLLSPSFHQSLHQALAHKAQATGDHTAFRHLMDMMDMAGKLQDSPIPQAWIDPIKRAGHWSFANPMMGPSRTEAPHRSVCALFVRLPRSGQIATRVKGWIPYDTQRYQTQRVPGISSTNVSFPGASPLLPHCSAS